MLSHLCGCRPEIYKSQEYRVEVDMFSFGVLLFRLLSGKRPFSSSSKKELALLVMGNKYTMDDDSWSVVSDEAKEFVRLLIIQRDRRLTAESASLHPWFRTRPPTGGSKSQHNLISETGSNLDPYDNSEGDSKLKSALVSIIRAGKLDREILARFGSECDARGGLGDRLAKALTPSISNKSKSTYSPCVGDPAGRRPIEPPGDYQAMLDKQASHIREKWVGSVFVSHTGRDKEGSTFAAHLCDSFRDEGIDFFFDAWDIPEGELFGKKILEGIDTCTVFVCVLTTTYFFRHWCMKELDRAFRSEKIIIPVYLPIEPPDVTDEFIRKFSNAHIEKLNMDHQVIHRWLFNVRKLKQIQAVWNHSQPKDIQVAMKKSTVKAVKYKLRKEPA